ncbi:hypothetical protein [Nonomuraea sp. WAC 01424]|uniref:hypothetical protein n=1 Tax=Nonomuraea sp. WAC 01424 TaxID=2203200 RepID=UPI0021ADA2A0|nr:hypothetical protein [Nonomuraea sp. WAC 01424]
MTSGNSPSGITEPAGVASGNPRRSRAGRLPAPHAAVLADYTAALERAPLADSTKTKYTSRLRGYLDWLAVQADAAALDGDPLTDAVAAAGAVRDFRRHLKDGRRAPNTIDAYLSAIDDFYARRGLGKPQTQRERDSRRTAPESWTPGAPAATSATSSSPPPRATKPSPCCPTTPACASPKSSAST